MVLVCLTHSVWSRAVFCRRALCRLDLLYVGLFSVRTLFFWRWRVKKKILTEDKPASRPCRIPRAASCRNCRGSPNQVRRRRPLLRCRRSRIQKVPPVVEGKFWYRRARACLGQQATTYEAGGAQPRQIQKPQTRISQSPIWAIGLFWRSTALELWRWNGLACSLLVLRFACAPQVSGPRRKRARVWKEQCAVGGDKHSKRRKSLGGFSRKAPRLAAARWCEARGCVLLGEYEIFVLLRFCALFSIFFVFSVFRVKNCKRPTLTIQQRAP
jgi:hypothetical protein